MIHGGVGRAPPPPRPLPVPGIARGRRRYPSQDSGPPAGGAAHDSEEVRATSAPADADPLEADLLAKARGGNLFAFEEIVKRHQRRVYAVALRIVRRHDVADDVTQEAFMRAHRALPSFDLARPFGPWIARIAANLALNHVRSPRAREQELPENHAETTAPDPGPLARVLEREAGAALERALERLPVEQRSVFVLRAVEDMS